MTFEKPKPEDEKDKEKRKTRRQGRAHTKPERPKPPEPPVRKRQEKSNSNCGLGRLRFFYRRRRRKCQKPKPEEIAVKLEFPRHTPSGHGSAPRRTVITMHGDEVIENADIVVTDNRIVAVGEAAATSPCPTARRSSTSAGTTIVPGFIDTHPHWTEIRRGVLDLQNWSFFANLAYGVTTGRDPQTATNDMFAYQDLVETGEIVGPRAYSTGPGVFPDTDFQSLEDAEGVVARTSKYYRTPYLKSYMVGNRKQRQWMVMACKTRRRDAHDRRRPRPEARPDATPSTASAATSTACRSCRCSTTSSQFWSTSGIFYTPTLMVAYGGPLAENYFYETTEIHDEPEGPPLHPAQHPRRPSAAARTGSARTSTSSRASPRRPPRSCRLAAKSASAATARSRASATTGRCGRWPPAAGPAWKSSASATIHGAEAMGHAQDLGSIEPGKLADLVVLNKNPLDDIHNTDAIRTS